MKIRWPARSPIARYMIGYLGGVTLGVLLCARLVMEATSLSFGFALFGGLTGFLLYFAAIPDGPLDRAWQAAQAGEPASPPPIAAPTVLRVEVDAVEDALTIRFQRRTGFDDEMVAHALSEVIAHLHVRPGDARGGN